MTPQWTIQGLWIYSAILAYLAASGALAVRLRTLGRLAWIVGFVAASGAVAWRWFHLGGMPIRNLYDVFLWMGTLMFPLTVFSRRVLRIRGGAFDAMLGAALLVPAGFVFSAEVAPLKPILQSPWFIPHVSAYLLAMVILAKSAIQAAVVILRPQTGAEEPFVAPDQAADRLARFGFPLLTAGLLMGAVWGKRAWGDYWNWDPKEMWSLATWLTYVGYFHARGILGRRSRRTQAGILLLGFCLILITLLWANLSRLFTGLHSYA